MEQNKSPRLDDPVITKKRVAPKPVRIKKSDYQKAWDKKNAGIIPLTKHQEYMLRPYDRWQYCSFTPYCDYSEERRTAYIEAIKITNRKRNEKSVRYKNETHRRANNTNDKKLGYSRVCSSCGELFGNSMFSKSHHTHYTPRNKHSKPNRTYCLDCRKKMNAEYYQKHKADLKARAEAINEAHRVEKAKKNGYTRHKWKNKGVL